MNRNDQTNRIEHRMERTFTVPATPDEVWAAIATADGIAAWMVPTTLDPRVGGEVTFDVGGGYISVGVVTDYARPTRFAYEEPWPVAEDMPTATVDLSTVTPIATEFLVESASGGSSVIRVVSSAYGIGADWEAEFWAEMVEGWAALLDQLATHFHQTASR